MQEENPGVEKIYAKLSASLNIVVVTTNRAKEALKAWLLYSNFMKPRTLQLGLIGESGVGKTQLVHQVVDSMPTHHLMVIRMSNMDEGMISGYPSPTNRDTVRLVMVEQYADEISGVISRGQKLVLMFDELNRAKPHAIRAVFNIIERKTWAGVDLPKDTAFIVATNPPTDIHQVEDIWGEEAALNGRFTLIGVRTNVGEFLRYVNKTNPDFHYLVDRYVQEHPRCLEDFEHMYDGKKYTSPAVMECVGEYVTAAENNGADLSDVHGSTCSAMRLLITGAGGEPFATDLFKFISAYKDIVKPTVIINEYSKIRNLVKQAINRDGDNSTTSGKTTTSLDCSQVAMVARELAEFLVAHRLVLCDESKMNISMFMSDLTDEILSSFVEIVKSVSLASNDEQDKLYHTKFFTELRGNKFFSSAMQRLIIQQKQAKDYM